MSDLQANFMEQTGDLIKGLYLLSPKALIAVGLAETAAVRKGRA